LYARRGLGHHGTAEGPHDSGARRGRRLDRQAAVPAIRGRARERVRDDDARTRRRHRRPRRATRQDCFNVLVGNDAHLKNWSFIYPDGRTTQLVPAYDLVSTMPYIADDQLALSLCGTRDFAKVDATLLRRFADHADVPRGAFVRAATETAAAR
jgi:hypothetical protein